MSAEKKTETQILRDELEKIEKFRRGSKQGPTRTDEARIAYQATKEADKVRLSEKEKEEMITAMNRGLWELEWFVGTVEARKTKEIWEGFRDAIFRLKHYFGRA